MLNEIFQECTIPKIHGIYGKPQSRVDTGLDSDHLNLKIAELRN